MDATDCLDDLTSCLRSGKAYFCNAVGEATYTSPHYCWHVRDDSAALGLRPASLAASARTCTPHGVRSGMPCSCHSTWPIRTLQFLPLQLPVSGARPHFPSAMLAVPDETRVRTFLYCMALRARIVLSSLMSDKDAYKSYVEATRRLTSFFVHPVSEV
ncbi:hypothetical protein HPB52_013063 [Rhipicephalus sanguineus]|uniref:Uncharacterized protein n=1 Tax=Rhipicephalus sanguineus TaxID=34632 RepID=A0A9D4YPT7_RHISA|nr:hypothetical protein HPB52_013063 [Rhipicephalus sanguineus]